MSLDLTLRSKETRTTSGTGIFVRMGGRTVELTEEEAREYFPHIDASRVLSEDETNIVWHGNITHNLGKMARNVKAGDYDLYGLLWRPDENAFPIVTERYVSLVCEGYAFLATHRKTLETFNPDNGWGDYDTLLHFTGEYIEALSRWDGKEWEIVPSR